MAGERIYLYDTTLRDGAQTQGVDFGAPDKTAIARELDLLGLDYIEGGWPGANPTDDAFFQKPPRLAKARLAAFGMTRRAGRSAANDPGLAAVIGSGVRIATLVGKTWDFHAEVALGVSRAENVAMIALAKASGFTMTRTEDPGVVGFRMALDEPAEPGTGSAAPTAPG